MIPQFTNVRFMSKRGKNTLMENITITTASEGDLIQTRTDGSTNITQLKVRKQNLKRVKKYS